MIKEREDAMKDIIRDELVRIRDGVLSMTFEHSLGNPTRNQIAKYIEELMIGEIRKICVKKND